MARKKRGTNAADRPATPLAADPGSRAPLPFPIVGIGASAGGLDALKEMLQALPSDTDMAFVLVLHLPPNHDSLLPEILSRVSAVPICVMKDGMSIKANCVYVLPGGSDIGVESG